jgi:hypothetical protein
MPPARNSAGSSRKHNSILEILENSIAMAWPPPIAAFVRSGNDADLHAERICCPLWSDTVMMMKFPAPGLRWGDFNLMRHFEAKPPGLLRSRPKTYAGTYAGGTWICQRG